MRLYGAKEYGRVAKNYGESVATSAMSAIYGGVTTLGIGAVLSIAVNQISSRLGASLLEKRLERHPPSHKYSPNLQKMVDRLYDLSGLDVDQNPVYDFRIKKDAEATKAEKILGEVFEKTASIPNAAASNINEPVIMISEPLLRLLTDKEEYAVLAHEFVHAAADHQKVTMPKRYLGTAAAVTSSLVSFMEFLNAGFIGVASSIVAASTTATLFKTRAKDDNLEKEHMSLAETLSDTITDAGARAARALRIKPLERRLNKLSSEAKKKKKASSPEELLAHKKAKRNQTLATNVVGVGVATAFNPLYAPIYGATKGVNTAITLSHKKLSRIFEFHADEAAVTKFEADPLALITALRKITAIVERSQVNANGFAMKDVNVGQLSRNWQTMNATHPPVSERAAALSKVARKMGYNEDLIDAAVNGEVDLGDTPDLPLAMAEQAAMMLHIDDHMHFSAT